MLGVAITLSQLEHRYNLSEWWKALILIIYLKLTCIFTRLLEWTSLKLSMCLVVVISEKAKCQRIRVFGCIWRLLKLCSVYLKLRVCAFLLSKSSVVILTPLVVFLNVLYLTGLCQIIDSSNFWCVFRLWQGSLCPDEWWRPTILNIGSKRDPICHYCWGTEEACFLRKDLWNKKCRKSFRIVIAIIKSFWLVPQRFDSCSCQRNELKAYSCL